MVMPLADISGEEKKAVKPIPISNKSPQAKGSRCEGGKVEGWRKKTVVVMFFELALVKNFKYTSEWFWDAMVTGYV